MTTYEAWSFLRERYKNRKFKSRSHYADYIPKAISVLGMALGIDGSSLEADDTSSEKIKPHDAWRFLRRFLLNRCVRSYAVSYSDSRPMRVPTHVLELHEVMTVIDVALDYMPHYMDQLPGDFTPKAARGMYGMRVGDSAGMVFHVRYVAARIPATRLSFTKRILSAFIKCVTTAREWSMFSLEAGNR